MQLQGLLLLCETIITHCLLMDIFVRSFFRSINKLHKDDTVFILLDTEGALNGFWSIAVCARKLLKFTKQVSRARWLNGMLVSVFTATVLWQSEQISVRFNTVHLSLTEYWQLGVYDRLGMALSRTGRQVIIKNFGGEISCEISDWNTEKQSGGQLQDRLHKYRL
jgi:hypothetical protein